MENVELLASARLEKVGLLVRSQLASVRRRKLNFLASLVVPPRTPTFDPLLGELQRLRLRLEFLLHKVSEEPPLVFGTDRALTAARGVLDDAVEMVELLIWLGGEIPADGETNSASACEN